MRIGIVGSRGLRVDIGRYIPKDIPLAEMEVVSGGAAGVDAAAERFADEHNLSKLVFKPEYELYGRSAPLKRNKLIVEASERLLALWDGHSRGAKYTIDYAIKMGIPVEVVIVDPMTGEEVARHTYNKQ